MLLDLIPLSPGEIKNYYKQSQKDQLQRVKQQLKAEKKAAKAKKKAEKKAAKAKKKAEKKAAKELKKAEKATKKQQKIQLSNVFSKNVSNNDVFNLSQAQTETITSVQMSAGMFGDSSSSSSSSMLLESIVIVIVALAICIGSIFSYRKKQS